MTDYYAQTNTSMGIKAISYSEINTHGFDSDFIAKTVMSTAVAAGILCASNPIDILSKQEFVESVSDNRTLDTNRQDLALLAKIREKALYPDNWDGNDAKAVDKKTINDAENFIRRLLGQAYIIHSPIISLAADGEINFLWVLEDFRFDLGFYGDQTFSYYGKASSGQEFISDEMDISEGLPEAIVNFIRK